MSYYWPDVIGCPGTGVAIQSLNSIICQSTLAGYWLNNGNVRRDHDIIAGSGGFLYTELNNRYNQPNVSITISG